MTTKSYRDLDIYKLAHELGVTLHKFSLKMPKHELYETGSQLRRASKSISANIVEGYGRRRYKAEFIRFLIFALVTRQQNGWNIFMTVIRISKKRQANFSPRLMNLGRK